jgi:hypothetical protein
VSELDIIYHFLVIQWLNWSIWYFPRLKNLINDHSAKEVELADLADQNLKLQNVVHELEQSLFQEREQSLRLTTENNRLRVRSYLFWYWCLLH